MPRPTRILAVSLLLLPLASHAPAQEPAAGEGSGESRDKIIEHVVQPGETLQGITYKYLGTLRLWRENWRLNPRVRDPNLLSVGQRLRVIESRTVASEEASVRKIANEVKKNLLQSEEWDDAQEGDRLKPGEGVRTGEASSTDLEFAEGSSLTLSENSRVFLKIMKTSLDGVRESEIALESGQVDLALLAPRPEKSDIQLVVGDTVSRPRPGRAGRADTRARKAAAGSELMVYEGASSVEAAGRAVEVAKGMGTTVPEGGPPNPPEKLLPRPALREPASGSRWTYANPAFRWSAVPGAASYTLEVCRDPGCTALVSKLTGIETPTWSGDRPEDALPDGALHWRVTAVAPSGLDGYPSRARALRLEAEERMDLAPPLVVALLVGPGRTRADGSFTLGSGAAVRLEARDDASGVAEIRYRWDEGPWQRAKGRDLTPPASGAEHRLTFTAKDRRGRESGEWTARVHRDIEAPPRPGASRPGGDR